MAGHICVGLLAHVDAGKTTLAESILYLTGSIRKAGRVDHQDAFLDTYELERARGITIFSKQAEFTLGGQQVTLLDTPGHVDFSAEMERTLQVLDYAVLVISGADGVQGHVLTLWRLLKQYQIPVFLFINKMDQEGTDRAALMEELQSRLDEHCLYFGTDRNEEEFQENLAMCEEEVLERYLENGIVPREDCVRLIRERKVFPCYFGSALKMTGVEEFLQGLQKLMQAPDYPEEFGARVYKIVRDVQGNRLTYLKVTGGCLKVKQQLQGTWINAEGQEEIWTEKADQIRVYSGASFTAIPQAAAGMVCAVTGLTKTYCGQGLGIEQGNTLPLLEPVLTYQVEFPPECDMHGMYGKLRQLEEEIPELHLVWNEAAQEIHVEVMGEVQIEILKSMIRDRFGIWVEFGSGSIVYKETIAAPVEGVGHFEPLRHYAEVHLLLEPGEPGSGLQFAANCSTDELDLNWQRLILTHLEEKQHRGVLTGTASVARMRGYQMEVTSYTRGCGRLFCSLKGYEPCKNPEEIIEAIGYDPDSDTENPTGSVFCTHGAGFVVPWDQVPDYMHLDYVTQPEGNAAIIPEDRRETLANAKEMSAFSQDGTYRGYSGSFGNDKELMEIFERTFGSVKQERTGWSRSVRNYDGGEYRSSKKQEAKEQYLLVDGYNIIYAWEELKELAKINLEAARGKLMDILCNYQGYRKMHLILVFDAYKVEGSMGEVQKYHNIYVVYTKEAETADQYIEKTVHQIGRQYEVTVATSDAAEQVIIWGQGAKRLSAKGLRKEIRDTCLELQEQYLQQRTGGKNYLFENLEEDMAAFLEDVRMGRKTIE